MHVEVIPRDPAKGNDVGFGYRATMRQQRLPDPQILEVAPERMHFALDDARTANVFTGDRREHIGRPLHRAALQIVFDGTRASQLLPAARASRPPVLERWQRRSMPCRFSRRLSIQNE